MKKIIAISKIVLGVLMPVAALIGYLPEPELLVEFSCISNVVTGILLIIDGILNLKDKKIPVRFFANSCVGLFVVFFICMGSLTGAYHMNFKGAFMFLHVIFPIFIMLFYIILCDDSEGRVIFKLLLNPVFLMAYFLFDFLLGKARGYFVYGFFEAEGFGVVHALIFGVVVYALLFGVGGIFLLLNRIFHRKKKDKGN